MRYALGAWATQRDRDINATLMISYVSGAASALTVAIIQQWVPQDYGEGDSAGGVVTYV